MRHSNWEGAVLERIHQSRTDGTDAIIINPGELAIPPDEAQTIPDVCQPDGRTTVYLFVMLCWE